MYAFLDFVRGYLSGGLWRAILFIGISDLILHVAAFIVSRISKFCGFVVFVAACAYGIFLAFFTWMIRGHIIWLVFGILTIIAAIIQIKARAGKLD